MSFIDFEKFNFQSTIYKEILEDVKKTSLMPVPLHISGPSGSGKSSWASWISKNYRNPQIFDLQSGSLNSKSFEEVIQNYKNDFVLLDHVDTLNLADQKILLDWLEKEAYRKKIVSTAKQNLFNLVQKGQFRSDLYYKLTVLQIQLPSLNQAKEEIAGLAEFYIRVYEILYSKNQISLSSEAVEKLKAHTWIDHIRELDQIIERAIVLSTGDQISDLHIQFTRPVNSVAHLKKGVTLSEMERQLILQTLQMTDQNRTQAAQILGISIRTLRNKLNEYKKMDVFEEEGHR